MEEVKEKYVGRTIFLKKMLEVSIKYYYNGHKEIKERRVVGTEKYMTRGHKTILEERIEIVSCCIENGMNYSAIIEKYDVL